jgi:hypothetical protein
MRETISDHSPTIFVEYDYDYCRDVDRNDGSWTAIDSLDELPTDAEHEHDHFMLRCR